MILHRKAQCGAKGGPQGSKCERRIGHEGEHMGSPKINGKRVATKVVDWPRSENDGSIGEGRWK